jgi:hypothetical protein
MLLFMQEYYYMQNLLVKSSKKNNISRHNELQNIDQSNFIQLNYLEVMSVISLEDLGLLLADLTYVKLIKSL